MIAQSHKYQSYKFIKILPDITHYIANIDYMTNIDISYKILRVHTMSVLKKYCNVYNFLDCISLVCWHIRKFCEFSLHRLSLVIIFTDSLININMTTT